MTSAALDRIVFPQKEQYNDLGVLQNSQLLPKEQVETMARRAFAELQLYN